MRRLTISIVLIILMTIVGAGLFIYTEQTADEIEGKLSRVWELTGRGDNSAALVLGEEALSGWEDFCLKNVFLTDRECSLEISDTLMKMNSLLLNGNDAAREECMTARQLLAYYRRGLRPLPENIF